VRRDEMECAPDTLEGALIEDNAGEQDLDAPDTSSSSGDADGGDDFEDACQVARTSRLRRSFFACNADLFSIQMILAELTLSQIIFVHATPCGGAQSAPAPGTESETGALSSDTKRSGATWCCALCLARHGRGCWTGPVQMMLAARKTFMTA
jgi:hypothetical protein